MTERFNSGHGGYTCDACNVLLWAGVRGCTFPEKRKFIYSTQASDIVERKTKGGERRFYCSLKCADDPRAVAP